MLPVVKLKRPGQETVVYDAKTCISGKSDKDVAQMIHRL